MMKAIFRNNELTSILEFRRPWKDRENRTSKRKGLSYTSHRIILDLLGWSWFVRPFDGTLKLRETLKPKPLKEPHREGPQDGPPPNLVRQRPSRHHRPGHKGSFKGILKGILMEALKGALKGIFEGIRVYYP